MTFWDVCKNLLIDTNRHSQTGKEPLCGLFNQNCCLCYLSDYTSWNQICIGVGLICFEIAHTHKSLCLKTGRFKVHNLHTHWSQGSSHPCLHAFLIWKCSLISFSQCLKSLFSQGPPPATSPPIIRWGKISKLSWPKAHCSDGQGEYLTETPLGPGGDASYSTVSILPTSLPVRPNNTQKQQTNK